MKANETIPGTKAVADRIIRAENEFAGVLMQFGGISEAEAEKAMRTMLKLKVAKRNGVDRIDVVHGAFLDREAIRNAAAYKFKGKR